jgi:hypothetical protein
MKFSASNIKQPLPFFWPACRAQKAFSVKPPSGLPLRFVCNILRRGTPKVLPKHPLWRSTRADCCRDAHRQGLRALTSPGDAKVWSWRYPALLGCRRRLNLPGRQTGAIARFANAAQIRERRTYRHNQQVDLWSSGVYAPKVVQLCTSAKQLGSDGHTRDCAPNFRLLEEWS